MNPVLIAGKQPANQCTEILQRDTSQFPLMPKSKVQTSRLNMLCKATLLQNIDQERMNYRLTYHGSTSTSTISGQPYNQNMLHYLETCHLQARTCQPVPQRTCHPLPKDLPSADQKNELETCHLQARTCHPQTQRTCHPPLGGICHPQTQWTCHPRFPAPTRPRVEVPDDTKPKIKVVDFDDI